jgi:hypothetical protein
MVIMETRGLFTSMEEIKKSGFLGFVSKAELFEDCTAIPKEKGVYLILYPSLKEPTFLEVGCGGFFKGKNPNVSIAELKLNWVANSQVIYIGKAGASDSSATLHSRLKQYFAFGQGKAVGHYGGRYIWQLQNATELIVCWKCLPNDEARNVESQLITEFVQTFGKRPFANLSS